MGDEEPLQRRTSMASASSEKYIHPFRRQVSEQCPDVSTADTATPSLPSSSPRPEWDGFPTDMSGGTGRYGYCLSQNQRPYMEDAIDIHLSLPNSTESTELYAVHDGHGGVGAVEFVRRRLRPLLCAHPDFNSESGLLKA